MPHGKKKKRVVETSQPPVRGRKRRRRAFSHSPVRSSISPSSPESTHSEEAEMAEQNNRNVSDYAIPKLDGLQHSIWRPSIQANNFEIKPATIQLLQANGQFGGSPIEDPNNHILNFLEICDTFKHNGVSDDAIRLRLFPFSLRDKAKVWLQSLPEGSISKWEELAQQFLTKYFPPGKTAKMRNDITSFVLLDNESLYEAWERFKELLRKCPHHGLPKWLQVQTFYNGLPSEIRTSIDVAFGGALMSKPVDAAHTLLETMSSNNHQWHSDRHVHARVAGGAVKVVSPFVQACENCGEMHTLEQCPLILESVQYLANRNANNPYSNTYNPGWRNHPNFSWSQNQGAGPSSSSRPNNPPEFNIGGFNQQVRALPPPTEKKPSLEEMMVSYMSKNDALMQSQNAVIQNQTALIQSQASSLRSLETQVGQLATALNNRQQGTLPSDTEPNPRKEGKEHCKAIFFRSGKEIEGNLEITKYEASKEAKPVVIEKPVEEAHGDMPKKGKGRAKVREKRHLWRPFGESKQGKERIEIL
ncbi:uncharacterized protein G2W53_018512 [Senna tora]|uniref:Retrotransposon gag domain-containing protein n=1 Tax=Senna tora TaxID=362788 RepID=A0A834TS52_9FABA|nr:uncharacterized protein G2W53_018512 [Senna tora]